jgi:hypothetical protein
MMIALTPQAKRELKLRTERLCDFKQFTKAQLKASQKLGNTVRQEYRHRWTQSSYKRRPGRPSHRSAIARSLTYIVKRLKLGVFRVKVGSSVKTNTMARIVNILNPGFTPRGARRAVPGKKIREVMLIRAQQLADQMYLQALEQQLQKQANGQ